MNKSSPQFGCLNKSLVHITHLLDPPARAAARVIYSVIKESKI